MTDSNPEANNVSSNEVKVEDQNNGNNFSERYGEIMGSVNDALNKVDWGQMGKYGKALGIITAVIVAQIIINGGIDTINLLPLVPGLLELLGVVVVGQWCWQNLTTSEKRDSVFERVQNLRKEYLG